YSIFAQSGFHDDTGMVTVYAGTSGDQIADLANLTIDELKRSAEDMTEAELARARAQLKAGLLMGLESPTGQAERMARSLAIWGRVADPAEVAERIDAVTVLDVRAHAETLIQNARPALALYGPVKSAPSRARLAERLAA
ncbi:M16 family metallopeptidase, partial [Paracoccus sp. (in: a-proteobacteria)]|uniref:M16 family metallopeptidase n=1 Tax=Paracoccus sp. TaxID=267 RepID=UPI0035B441AF